MGLKMQSLEHIAINLISYSRHNHMILYVGQDVGEHDITPEICSLPWSCIITSHRDDIISTAMGKAGKQLFECTTRGDIPRRTLNRKQIPIWYLYGLASVNSVSDADDAAFKLLGINRQESEARGMLDKLPELLSDLTQLVVMGYDSQLAGELNEDFLVGKLISVREGNVLFFGEYSYRSERFQALAEHKGFTMCAASLNQVLAGWLPEEDASLLQNMAHGKTLFYIEGTPATINDELLEYTNGLATVVTENRVTAVAPRGRVEQERWFQNFLEASSVDGPQWYGYHAKSEFYVKRSFEDTLVTFVNQMLSGKDGHMNWSDMPIILGGHPCSSKSVTLGALAYKVYSAHQHPVIFISERDISFYYGSVALNNLDKLMQAVENAGEASARVLVIWDCSSYRNSTANIIELHKELKNRGRRFVLVCSSYLLDENDSSGFQAEKPQSERYVLPQEGTSPYRFLRHDAASENYMEKNKRYYYIPTSRIMTEEENLALRMRFKLYSGIDAGRLSSWWNRLKAEGDDIFNYYYKLNSLIRPNLEAGLSREQRIIGNYVQQQLHIITKEYEKPAMRLAFEQVKNDLAAYGLDLQALERDEDGDQFDLRTFNVCIAIFSRFNQEVPFGLAIKLLGDRAYSNIHQLSRLLEDIPWLRYRETLDGSDFTYSFRNALEADIFLENNNITELEQIDLLCQILDYAGEQEAHDRSIQFILRMYGPNTNYPYYKRYEGKHREVLRHLPKIIEKLKALREDGLIDENAGYAILEVTFTREYYGYKYESLNREEPSDDSYLFRLEQLKLAEALAVRKAEEYSASELGMDAGSRRTTNVLVVEIALCNLAADMVQEGYHSFCEHKGTLPRAEWRNRKFIHNYPELFRKLQRTIYQDPSNGYAYNALFRLFLREYERPYLSSEKRLQYLVEVFAVIDSMNPLERVAASSRGMDGRDELASNLSAITAITRDKNYSTVSITDVQDGQVNSAFMSLYKQMLEERNPATIIFLCRQELDRVGALTAKDDLTSAQLERCEAVRQFMLEEHNFSCIEHNAYALQQLLDVTWKVFTSTPLFSQRECRLTKLSVQQWNQVHQISKFYHEACASNGNANPDILLMYALSTLQITGSLTECERILKNIHEGQFFMPSRMKVPFMYCDEMGAPYKFNATVDKVDTQRHRGLLRLHNVEGESVHFHMQNLGLIMPQYKAILKDIELAVGYVGLAGYNKAGRLAKEEQ